MRGAPLKEMEKTHPKPDTSRCKHARHFVLRLVPDPFAFLTGLPARMLTAQHVGDDPAQIPLSLGTLGAAVREGCDSAEVLAVRIDDGRSVSRVAARKHYEEIKPHIQAGSAEDTFDEVLIRVREAAALFAFLQ